jgi:hypothetical protein
MTDKITLELTLEELKLIDKYVELNDETQSVFDKIKYAYPQLKMTLYREGQYAVVSYNDTTYYRLKGETTCFSWWIQKGVSANHPMPTLTMISDAETERLLEGLYYNYIEVKKEKVQERGERVHNEMEEVVRESVKWCEEHPDTDPLDWLKPQTPEQVADGLKEAFREAVKQGVVSSTKRETLTDVIWNWWEDVFTTNSNDDMKTSIDDLVARVEAWLPEEHATNSYKWNQCIRTIKEKLR